MARLPVRVVDENLTASNSKCKAAPPSDRSDAAAAQRRHGEGRGDESVYAFAAARRLHGMASLRSNCRAR
jgi:hypothetical protein